MVGSQSRRGGQESGLRENDLSADRAPSRGIVASSSTSRLFTLEGLTVGFWNPYLWARSHLDHKPLHPTLSTQGHLSDLVSQQEQELCPWLATFPAAAPVGLPHASGKESEDPGSSPGTCHFSLSPPPGIWNTVRQELFPPALLTTVTFHLPCCQPASPSKSNFRSLHFTLKHPHSLFKTPLI